MFAINITLCKLHIGEICVSAHNNILFSIHSTYKSFFACQIVILTIVTLVVFAEGPHLPNDYLVYANGSLAYNQGNELNLAYARHTAEKFILINGIEKEIDDFHEEYNRLSKEAIEDAFKAKAIIQTDRDAQN